MMRRLFALLRAAVLCHLTWIWQISVRSPRLIPLGTLLLLIPALWGVSTTRFEFDIFRLFPAQKGALRLFLDSLEWTGSGQEAFFVLEGKKELLIPAATEFAGKLETLKVDGAPAFNKVTWRTMDPAEAHPFAEFVSYAVTRPELFLTPADMAALKERLTPQGMDGALRRATTELAGQGGMVSRELIAGDPLGLRELILPRLRQASQALDLDSSSPYFLSRDGQVLIIIAEPARPVQEMAFARKLVAGINGARAGSPVRISCAGAHLSAVIDEASMKGNIISCILSSLVVVLGIFYFTYRRLLPTLLIPVIISCGVFLALGTAGIFLPSIHIISFAFTALIIGLGTDYSIHIYDRFYWERTAGVDPVEALRLAIVDTGYGVFTAAFTTAVPFLALTISDVRVLFELGLLVGLGVLFSLYATYFFLPPLLLFMERRFPLALYHPLPSFGLGELWDGCLRFRRAIALVTLLLIVVLLGTATRIGFEGDLKKLQPRQSEAMLTQEKIEQHLNLSPKSLMVAVEGTDLDDVLSRGARVDLLAERYRQRGELVAWSSLGQILNGPLRQREMTGLLATALTGSDPAALLRTALKRNGFDPLPFSPALAGISSFAAPRPGEAAQAVQRLSASPLKGVVQRHLIRHNGIWRLLSHLFYQGEEFHRDRFLGELAVQVPGARVTGIDLVGEQLSSSVRQSFGWSLLLGSLLVMLLLMSHFDSRAGIFASLFPVFAGGIAMLGLLVLTGMRINFMNSMVVVTILGMGSDYGLHIFHRAGIAGPKQREQFIQAGRAVLLSALTTIAGFGSLAFTDYGAMSSIGWATNYGIIATALFSLVSLPAFLALFGPSHKVDVQEEVGSAE
jgi:uncharacterized protein